MSSWDNWMEGKKGALYYSTEENHLANSAQTFFHWIKIQKNWNVIRKKADSSNIFSISTSPASWTYTKNSDELLTWKGNLFVYWSSTCSLKEVHIYYTRDLPGKCSGNDGAISQKIDAAVKNVISFYFPTSLSLLWLPFYVLDSYSKGMGRIK